MPTSLFSRIITLTATGIFVVIQAAAQWAGTNPITTNSNIGIGTTTATGRLNIQSGFNIEDAGIGCQIYNNTGPALRIHWATNNPGFYGCSGSISGVPNIIDVTGYTYNSTSSTTPTVVSLLKMNTGGDMAVGGAPVEWYKFAVAGRSQFANDVQVRGKVRIANSTSLTPANFSSVPYSFSVDEGDARFLNKVRIGALAASGGFSSYKLSVDGDIVCKRAVVQTGS